MKAYLASPYCDDVWQGHGSLVDQTDLKGGPHCPLSPRLVVAPRVPVYIGADTHKPRIIGQRILNIVKLFKE
jgi:hypothetical protein